MKPCGSKRPDSTWAVCTRPEDHLDNHGYDNIYGGPTTWPQRECLVEDSDGRSRFTRLAPENEACAKKMKRVTL